MKFEHMFPCMGYSTLILRYGRSNIDVTFLDPYFSLKTHFCHFPTRRVYFFLKLNFEFFCRSLCCISLNHNSVLLSKQNSVHDPKRRKIHLFFYRNYNYYTKCVVIWCSAPVSDVKTAMQNRRVWRAMTVDRRQHSISVAAYEFMIMTIRIQV